MSTDLRAEDVAVILISRTIDNALKRPASAIAAAVAQMKAAMARPESVPAPQRLHGIDDRERRAEQQDPERGTGRGPSRRARAGCQQHRSVAGGEQNEQHECQSERGDDPVDRLRRRQKTGENHRCDKRRDACARRIIGSSPKCHGPP